MSESIVIHVKLASAEVPVSDRYFMFLTSEEANQFADDIMHSPESQARYLEGHQPLKAEVVEVTEVDDYTSTEHLPVALFEIPGSAFS